MLIVIIGEDGDVAHATLEIVGGQLEIIAEVALSGRILQLRGLHVQGVGFGANSLGPAALRRIVREAMEELNVDAIEVAGARRTTGAVPGRAPRLLRFTRHRSIDE